MDSEIVEQAEHRKWIEVWEASVRAIHTAVPLSKALSFLGAAFEMLVLLIILLVV
ncbi:hypothetical protein GCM10010919_29000 [Alishewanella longhuensis]|uniref:Uncharacterized protein n=2 Tax=Alishewanella longhuensis TaxID=1091037 RepID=A0ABQ3L2B1_9ALTE|nr:hypothetical protein GCM10010919_29000 [Alishewanella longhuensis]